MENQSIYPKRVLSFKYALEGIVSALKEEPNLKFHFVIASLTIIAGIFFQISKIEWLIIIILIGLVFTIELTNTAIEVIVDSFTAVEHPQAKLAKDISAGAVLIASLASLVVGIIIFLPYLWPIFYH